MLIFVPLQSEKTFFIGTASTTSELFQFGKTETVLWSYPALLKKRVSFAHFLLSSLHLILINVPVLRSKLKQTTKDYILYLNEMFPKLNIKNIIKSICLQKWAFTIFNL